MAHEAVKRYSEGASGDFIQDYTVADGTGIEKGALLALTDPRTAILVSAGAGNQVLAGIAAREKVASDGRTRLSVHKKGYFDMYASGTITIGQCVCSSGTVNYVSGSNPLTSSGAQILGYAEEAATDGEQVLIRVDL